MAEALDAVPLTVEQKRESLAMLKQLSQGTGPMTATARAFGNASSSPLHFTIKLKLYTQVFTPKKG